MIYIKTYSLFCTLDRGFHCFHSCGIILIWVCTVCICPTKRMLGLNGLTILMPYESVYRCKVAEKAQIMICFLSIGEGAQWNNFHQPGTVDDNFSLLDSMIMLWVDTVIYMLIAWYVDNINPGDAGVAQPPWFVFLVSI